MATTYCLSTTLNGHNYQVDYWPDGEGQKWPGYVTSLSQYRSELRDHFSTSKVKLYVVKSPGCVELIENDYELKNAVEYLPDGGTLSVTAFGGGTHYYSRGRRNGRRYYDEWQWYENDSDDSTSASSNSSSASSGDSDKTYVGTYNTNVRAIKRRFGVSSRSMWYGDAPHYPLCREENHTVRSEVCHLQYILTRLGYMTLSATKQLVGSYQTNTERAVRKFREHYGIYGSDMTVYNKKTARKMAQVVDQLRNQGHWDH